MNKVALSATLHCLTGCAIGEILGTVLGSAIGFSNIVTVVAAFVLSFASGYTLAMLPLLRHGLGFVGSLKIALAADTLSILTMELVDNLIVLIIPGALTAGPLTLLFWGSLAVSLFIAFWAAFPVNAYLIARGKGHALAHEHHAH